MAAPTQLECYMKDIAVQDDKDGLAIDVTFHVKYDCACVGPNYVLQNADCLPAIGDAYDYPTEDTASLSSLCNSRRVRVVRKAAPSEYDVTCRFQPAVANNPSGTPHGEVSDNPLDWCPRISFGGETREVAVEKATFKGIYELDNSILTSSDICLGCTEPESVTLSDVANTVFRMYKGRCAAPVNSVGQVFVPPLTRRRSDIVVRVTKNVLSYAAANDECFIDTVNDAEITLAYPNVWENGKVYAAGATVQDADGNVFYTVAGGTSSGDMSDLAGGSDTGVTWVASTSNCWPGQFTIPANWGYMRSIAGNPQTYDYDTGTGVSRIRYYEKQWEIIVRRGGWFSDYLNRGTHRAAGEGDPDAQGGTISAGDIVSGMSDLAPIRDSDGEPIAEPIRLGPDGQPVSNKDLAYYLRYLEYFAADWSDGTLGLL